MKSLFLILTLALLCAGCSTNNKNDNDMNLVQEWDKTFPKSEKVTHEKVTFKNRFGITLVADVYKPTSPQPSPQGEGALKDSPANEKGNNKTPSPCGEGWSGVVVSGPFGAVKEQCSGLYAQTLAERGFLTIAFDPSFTGESFCQREQNGAGSNSAERSKDSRQQSSGEPRYVASPDINTEDFQAAVDYLISRQDVDSSKIGICGICGWGGIALNAAAIDTRVKATVAVTMYDMSRVNHNGYFDAMTEDELYALKQQLNAQRNKDFAAGSHELGGGVIDPLPDDAPLFVKDYHAYYKTPRGYHARSLNSNGGWNITSSLSWINAGFLARTKEIRSAVLILHGEDAHSCYFGRDAYANMTSGEGAKWAGNKELLIIPGTSHTDLYDGGENRDKIPFDKIADFYITNLR